MKRVVGVILTGSLSSVREINQLRLLFQNKKSCYLLHHIRMDKQAYLGPNISSGRTHASNCCSVQ